MSYQNASFEIHAPLTYQRLGGGSLIPARSAVEIKPEPIEWTIVNGVKFAPLEFQYIQSHLYMNSVREAGVFRCVAGDTTYYEVELDYNAESLFRSVNRPYYAFNAEGRMSPSRREFDLGTEDDILEDLLSIDEFDIARSKPHQLPKPGSAYVGRQGSFRMALVFDGMGTVAFASLEGATDKIRYVRYYAVGTESGALVTVTYTTGGQAHFVMLLECENAGITQGDNLYYDVNTFYLWDDISFAMTVMAHEQPVTAILQPRGIRPPKSGFEGFVLGAGRPTLYHGREWLFGQGARNDEYSVAPIRPDRNYVIPFSDIEEALNKNMTIMQWAYASGRFARPYKFPAIRASIYHISPEGVTHYYEAFVDTFGMTKACFFGIHEWEYPLSDGQSEKPLRDRILDMDHPVTKDLNGLCERNVLLPRTGLEHIKGFKFGDLEPHSGNFTGFLENGTLRLEFEEAGAKAFEEGWLVQSYDKIAHYRVLHALIAAVYPTGSGEKDGRVLILRQPGTTMETYLDDLNARLPGGIRKMDLKGWDTA
ncbi:hypothetical protein FOZ61_003511 [Perkinsus olseni]|nr:hypothetical protein FOZ61_003511 [Perkinsus olseni]